MRANHAVIGIAAGLVLLAGCGGGDTKSAPLATTTTLAISLPPEDVSLKARGVLALEDFEPGWTVVDRSELNVSGYANLIGPCTGSASAPQIVGFSGKSFLLFEAPSRSLPNVRVVVWVFPSVDAARSAFQAGTELFACPDKPLDRSATSSNGVISERLAAIRLGDESFAERVETFLACDAVRPLPMLGADIVFIRDGAQVFEFAGDVGQRDIASCDPLPYDTPFVYATATKAMKKYEAELKRFTREVYARRATASTAD